MSSHMPWRLAGKRGQAVHDNADLARLSAVLGTIVVDAKQVTLTLEDLKSDSRDVQTLRALFMKWQFRTHLKELQAEEVTAHSEVSGEHYKVVSSVAGLAAVAKEIQGSVGVDKPLAIDLRFDSEDLVTCGLQAVGLCWARGQDGLGSGPLPGAALGAPGAHLLQPTLGQDRSRPKERCACSRTPGLAFDGALW